ncbi:hypothetical protein ACLOJK_006728 [Asimina triloba]
MHEQIWKGFNLGELSGDQDSLKIHVQDLEDYSDPFKHGHQDLEWHSVSGQVRAQRSGALKAWVKSADVPSGSIQTQHQDPEGLSGNWRAGDQER